MTKVGEIKARITLDNSSFNRGMDEAKGKMEGMSGSTKSVKRDLDTVQKASGIVGTAIVAGLGVAVTTAANFESAMARVKAISGATDEEFKRLEQTARDLGSSTQYSATEAAGALEYLAMAGFEVNDAIDAMPGVLNLAAASQESLATSADIVSNIMSGFGLSAEDADAAVDVLVQTMTTANTNLPQLGAAMKYVAPVAASLGIDMEDVAAAVGKMSDAGIQGSQAGTALRSAMLSLANPTGQTVEAMADLGIEITTADGAMKPLPELIGHIADKLGGMEEAQKTAAVAQLVGQEAASGFLALLEVGEDGLADYSNELRNSAGAAEEMAKIQQDSVNGAFKEMQSALEEVGISIGNEFLPAFRDIIEVGTDVIRWIGELDEGLVTSVITFAGVAAGIAFVITTLGKLSIALAGTMAALGPAGWLILGLSAIGGFLAVASSETAKFREVNLETADSLAESSESLRAATEGYETLSTKSRLTSDEFQRFLDLQTLIDQAVDDSKIKELTAEQEALLEKSGLSNDEMGRMVDLNGQLIEAVPESAGAISEQGNQVVITTDKIKDYNASLEDATLRELDRQRIIAESTEADTRAEINKLQAELTEGYEVEKGLREEFASFDEGAVRSRIEQLDVEIEALGVKGRNNTELHTERERLRESLTGYQENLLSQVESNQKLEEKLAKLNEEIGMVDVIDAKMLEVLLSQQGINAEKGKEIEAIDTAVTKLEGQKQKLIEQTPANRQNTDEFRSQVSEIDSQISGLNTTKQKVLEVYAGNKQVSGELSEQVGVIDTKIGALQRERSELLKNTPAAQQQTAEFRNGIAAIDGQIAELGGVRSQIINATSDANAMNAALAKSIYKDVFVKTHGDGGGVTRGVYHTGGIVGKQPLNQLPKLHTGGTVAKLAESFKAPMQHEMDVRLLRNEMVLTESQQANLMRMIDAGHTAKTQPAGFDPAVAALLSQIAQNTAAGKNVKVTLSSDEVYEVVQDKMAQEHDYINRFRGVLD